MFRSPNVNSLLCADASCEKIEKLNVAVSAIIAELFRMIIGQSFQMVFDGIPTSFRTLIIIMYREDL